LICKINIPTSEDNETKLLTATLTYVNVIGGCRDEQRTVATITRMDSTDERLQDVKVDFNLDKQRNRVIAAEALKRGNELGESRKLKEARETLQKAIDTLEKSVSAKDTFVVELVEGLRKAMGMLRSEEEYTSMGSKNMISMSEAHYQQRSNMSSPAAYSNMKKMKMKSSLQSWKQKKIVVLSDTTHTQKENF